MRLALLSVCRQFQFCSSNKPPFNLQKKFPSLCLSHLPNQLWREAHALAVAVALLRTFPWRGCA
jgi:hypothetical protein